MSRVTANRITQKEFDIKAFSQDPESVKKRTNYATAIAEDNLESKVHDIDDVTKKRKDTIGYEPVLKYFEGRDYKNMFIVPGIEGKEFDIEIGTVEKVQGLLVPTFYAKTEKRDLLKGMNESLIKQELEANATDQIKGEYVSVGSLDEVSTGGNWPPSYDKQQRDKN